MARWECKIEKVSNGFICTTYIPEEDDVYTVEKEVFSESNGDDDSVGCFITLVWHLAEYYGCLGSKHDIQRFWVGLRDQSGVCKDDI